MILSLTKHDYFQVSARNSVCIHLLPVTSCYLRWKGFVCSPVLKLALKGTINFNPNKCPHFSCQLLITTNALCLKAQNQRTTLQEEFFQDKTKSSFSVFSNLKLGHPQVKCLQLKKNAVEKFYKCVCLKGNCCIPNLSSVTHFFRLCFRPILLWSDLCFFPTGCGAMKKFTSMAL